jgi:hypothetical protein
MPKQQAVEGALETLKRVCSNQGAAGINGITLMIPQQSVAEFLREPQATLREGKYRPQTVMPEWRQMARTSFIPASYLNSLAIRWADRAETPLPDNPNTAGEDSKFSSRKAVWVQVPPPVLLTAKELTI